MSFILAVRQSMVCCAAVTQYPKSAEMKGTSTGMNTHYEQGLSKVRRINEQAMFLEVCGGSTGQQRRRAALHISLYFSTIVQYALKLLTVNSYLAMCMMCAHSILLRTG